MRLMRLALALALAAILAGPVGAATVTITPDNAWHTFDVDSFSANSGGLEWIDIDGTALTFAFTTPTPVTLTVVNGGFGGNRFQVFDNGQPLDDTLAGADTYPESKGLNFDAALADARWSRRVYTLVAGNHSITGSLSRSAVDGTGSAINATVGAVRVDAAPNVSGDGGGCTINPGAGFDPMILGITGLLLAYIVWQGIRKRSLSSRGHPMRFRRIALGVTLSLAVVGSAFAQSQSAVTVKIIAVNDFHGNLQSPGNFSANASSPSVSSGGVEVLAGYVADLKSKNPNNVVVSAGDLIGASPLISALFHDEATIESMNRLGLDFDAVGNHEFDQGKDELLRMQNGGCHPTDVVNTCRGVTVGTPVPFEGGKFKFLAANVVNTATGKTLFIPYGIKSFGGIRVAFIGMTLEDTPTIVTPTGVAGLRFNDEADTANALIPRLRARGVEAIVVLIHQGGFQSTPPSPPDINACVGGLSVDPIKDIVSKLDDAVDLVISGHTHAAYNCLLPNKAGRNIPVTSASSFGRLVTDIDMQIDPSNGQVLSVKATNIVVDRTNTKITPNTTIQGIVDKYSTLVSPIANQVIGSITTDIPNIKNAACEVPAGDLIADAQFVATQPASFGGAQIGLMNPGGVRATGFVFSQSSGGEPPGDVTYGEAFTVQPFGNSLVTMTLTAQQLKDVLEQQFAGCTIPGQPAQIVNRLLLPSNGFKFTWDFTMPACQKIRNVSLTVSGVTETIVQNGAVNNPTKTYRVTVNSFLATGGDGFTVLNNGTNRLGGAQDIDALVAYLADFKKPKASYDPNATALGKPRILRADSGTACP